MKKMILSLLAIAAMTSCTTTSEDEIDPNAPVEIKMQGNIEVNTIARSVGAVTPGSAVDDIVFVRADGATAPTDWTSASVTSIDASIAADKAITFNPLQYYSMKKETNTYLIGYHPKTNTTLKNGIVEFTSFNGQQDIMYANVVNGNKNTSTALAPSFQHKLSQLKFKFVKGTGYAGTSTIKSIVIKGTHIPTSMAIVDGGITYDATTTDITAFSDKTYNISTDGVLADEVAMVEVGANKISLDITLNDGTSFSDINISLTTVVSTAHIITLTFTQKQVSSEATIGTWTESDVPSTEVQ